MIINENENYYNKIILSNSHERKKDIKNIINSIKINNPSISS